MKKICFEAFNHENLKAYALLSSLLSVMLRKKLTEFVKVWGAGLKGSYPVTNYVPTPQGADSLPPPLRV